MKRFLMLVALLSMPAMAARTSEVLVTTAGVQMPALPSRVGLEIYNYGPNALHCSFGTAISSNAFWVIAALDGTVPGHWTAGARTYHAIFCAAVSSNQSTGAAAPSTR